MKSKGIKAKTKRRFTATTKSRHDFLVADNILNRRFSVNASNITFIWTREGWLYLAAILDIFNRQIVGWSMGDTLSHGILADALHKALVQRNLMLVLCSIPIGPSMPVMLFESLWSGMASFRACFLRGIATTTP
jgi:hypothetical protein